jgi:hypothetical protein
LRVRVCARVGIFPADPIGLAPVVSEMRIAKCRDREIPEPGLIK